MGTPCDAVASTVRAGRLRLGLTQVQLAKRIGASAAAIAFWETGRSAPSGKFRGPLAAVLGCDEVSLRSPGSASPRITTPRKRSAREITVTMRAAAATSAAPTPRARRQARRRSRESARLDALVSEILEGEHGTGHRPGARTDLCPSCAAGSGQAPRNAARRSETPSDEPRIKHRGGRRR